MRQFYTIYADDQIGQTLSDQFENLPMVSSGRRFYLSWSHYLKLMRITDIDERHFYEIESAKNDWSLAELQRQFDSALYQRIALSTEKDKVYELATRGQVINKPSDLVKEPYVLELGTGFTFVGRQVRFTYEEEHFRVDLVFYNRIARCFVLFDLKIGKLKHQDIGQMQMYVNYYDRKVKLPDENKTIGIVMCRDKNDAVVEMTLPEDNDQIFASKYLEVLPSKEKLQKLLSKHLSDDES